MKRNLFSELTKQYFWYLIDDYSFDVVYESYWPHAFVGVSTVKFGSRKTVVEISLEGEGNILVWISLRSVPDKPRFTLGEVIEFLSPGSHAPIFSFPLDLGRWEKSLEFRLSELAHALRQYCEPILREDFSRWKELEEFSARKLEEFTKEKKNKK